LPDRGTGVEAAVQEIWDLLQAVDSLETLAVFKRLPKVTERLAPYSDDEVLKAIYAAKGAKAGDKPVKQVELDALLAAPEGFGDDVPIDQNFHARRLPDHAWRHTKRSDGIEAVIQLHRLREVLALVGFTRFEAVTPDIQGEYETDVERAQIALEPSWFPAVENRAIEKAKWEDSSERTQPQGSASESAEIAAHVRICDVYGRAVEDDIHPV
jgi:hypothetical protein